MMKPIVIISCLLLGACASNVESSWQCPNPVPNGSPCTDIAGADGMVSKPAQEAMAVPENPVPREVTANVIGSAASSAGKLAAKSGAPFTWPWAKANGEKGAAVDIIVPDVDTETKDDVLLKQRAPERVARVWFAPFIDKYNNRHEESIIYVVDQESTWRTE